MIKKAITVLSLIALNSGCQNNHANLKIVERPIPLPTDEEEQRRVALMNISRPISESEDDEVIKLADSLIETGNPYLAIEALHYVSIWAGCDEDKKLAAYPLIQKCMASSDQLFKLAGINALDQIDYHDRVRQALDADCSFLLVRPRHVERNAVTRTEREEVMRRIAVAYSVELRRESVIYLIGEYGIRSAIPVLEKIRSANSEWRDGTKQAIEKVLRQLEIGTVLKNDS